MKKFFKWLILIIVPFGWLVYILLNKKLRRVLLWKAKKFLQGIFLKYKQKSSPFF